MKEYIFSEKWQVHLPGNLRSTLKYAVDQWIACANAAYNDHGFFAVALSGGSTPKLIYQYLTAKENRDKIPWENTYLFWSDERSVPSTHVDSNYRMALVEGGFNCVPIKNENIFRMPAEKDIEQQAIQYEKTILDVLGKHPFDLIMLGIGDDGHTASLFPHTEALHISNRLVVANFVPQLNTWRMSFTFECINRAKKTFIYAFGEKKSAILEKVFNTPYNPDLYPIHRVGGSHNKASFIIDDEASKYILPFITHK